MITSPRRLVAVVLAVLLVAVPRAALACPVCFGNSDAPMAKATNAGIIFMLGVVVLVLAGFASFIVHLVRQARLVNDQQSAEMSAYGLSGERPTEGTL
jgi:hypothetical protein